jgi:hypothetical protein
MGNKHIYTYLDNVSIRFDNFRIKSDCIMDKKPIKNFYDIADRLLTGRLLVASSAIKACKNTLSKLHTYVSNKEIYIDKELKTIKLIELPHIKTIFDKFDTDYKYGSKLIEKCIDDLTICLKTDTKPTPKLIEKINCAKIFCAETSRNTIYEIQTNLGSASLLIYGANPSIYVPYIVAEGDCGILRQKIASDCMKIFIKNKIMFLINVICGERCFSELLLLLFIMMRVFIDVKYHKYTLMQSYFLNYKYVIALSQIRIMHIIRSQK